jgi:hypothetical protein
MNTRAVLTETNDMKVKPGEGKMANVEIQYKIWKSIVNTSATTPPKAQGGHTQMQQ